ASGVGVGTVHGLDVHVRLGGVAGVAAGAEFLAGRDPVARSDAQGAGPQVGQEDVAATGGVGQDHVVAGECGAALAGPLGLRQRVGQAGGLGTPRFVVRFAVVDGDHL